MSFKEEKCIHIKNSKTKIPYSRTGLYLSIKQFTLIFNFNIGQY